MARRVGGGVLALVLVGIVATLILSGYTLAPGFLLHADFERIGTLRPGAKVKMGGRAVGEIIAIRLAPKASFLQKKATADGPEEPRLTLDLWLRLTYRKNIHRNSEFFINQVGVLGEQYLEIGPPRGEPGPVVANGEHVRGADPPRMDRMLRQGYDVLQATTTLMRELKPLGRELSSAADHLREIARQAGIDPERTRVIADRVAATIEDSRTIYLAYEQGTHSGADLKAIRADFGRLGDRVGDDLKLIGRELDRIMDRLEAAKDLWSPARRARLTRAFETLQRVVTIGERIARDARAMIAMVERGEGTIGAFMHDRELWDDFHAMHKLMKDKPWSTVVRPPKPERE
jgi:phospholipid/cholesterol/gamma-HCH transport system substrate-binding protein